MCGITIEMASAFIPIPTILEWSLFMMNSDSQQAASSHAVLRNHKGLAV